MSQNPSDTTQTVKTPVIRVGDALVRDGETITGNPALTKYLGNHLAKPATNSLITTDSKSSKSKASDA